MSRIAYATGRYVPRHAAAVHIEDRGFEFADAVYEVTAVSGGGLVDEAPHLQRLGRSLGELRIARPMSEAALKAVMREVIRRNGVRDGIIYLQISRGAAPRDFAFPRSAQPSVVMAARRHRGANPRPVEEGGGVIPIPDIRLAPPAIKSVALLPN